MSVPLTANCWDPEFLNFNGIVSPEMSRELPVFTVSLILTRDTSPEPVHVRPAPLKVILPVGPVVPPTPNVIVPLLARFPARVNVRSVALSLLNPRVAPALIVTEATLGLVFSVTIFAPVVAMTTSSPATGTAPPTQVVVAVQRPPLAVLVTTAIALGRKSANRAIQIKAQELVLG